MFRKIRQAFYLIRKKQASLFNSYIFYSVSIGLSGLIQICLLTLYARVLSTKDFGMLAVLLIVIPLASKIVNLGSDIGFSIKVWKRHKTKRGMDVSALLTLTVLNTGFITAILMIVDHFIDIPMNTMVINSVICIALLRTCIELLFTNLRREGLVIKIVIITLIRTLVFGFASITLLILLNNHWSSYIYGMFISEGLIAVWALIYLNKKYKI